MGILDPGVQDAIKGRKLKGYRNKKKAKKGKSSNSGAGAAAGGGILSGIFSPRNLVLNPGGQASSLAEAIEKQAVTQKRQAIEKSIGSGMASPFDMLQSQLFDAVNGINIAPTPIEELRKMAESQVSAQFDPMLKSLKTEMGLKTDRANRSQKQAREMYGGMSKDFLAQLPELTQQFAAEDQAVNARYDQAQDQLRGEYQKNAADQEAVLKRLGIQAASQDASQQAQDDQAYFQSQMEMDQQQSLNALNEQQMAEQNYTRSLGNNARMAGENVAQDIRTMLEDYMTQADSQMQSIQSQRGSALAALLQQMQAQDQQRVQQASQQEFDNMLKLFNFQLDATNSAQKFAQSGADSGMANPFGGDKMLSTGLPGAQNYLASVYPDQPILASNLMEQINDVLSNKQVTQGKFILEPGNEALGKAPKYSDVGQQMMEDLLRREFEKENGRYSTQDINATMAALQAYLGKLR